ncbi:MAG TPA: patatin-like phospholipase family protein [Burkholderiales bacterium]|nr:patatin-like phospholipase family protein [Burkholderiales bacterium]
MNAPQRMGPGSKGKVVLVLQGGGALGAYQAGVYEALCGAGTEPDWVIGTSIGAINAGIIAGNAPENRLSRLREFWKRVEQDSPFGNFTTLARGIPAFFAPRPITWGAGAQLRVGLDMASYYDTAPLRETLTELIDARILNETRTRLTVGAVNVRSSQMRYFDSRELPVCLDHIMASGALPPAFPAIRVEGEAYWDGGLYSNTPLEAVLDDNPRRDSVIFAVNVWQPTGPEPASVWEVMGREKDIMYASRADSHIMRQKQIHRLRHVIRELTQHIPPGAKTTKECKELASWGCATVMHVVRLLAPALASEDYFKDIDFSPGGIRARWQAGIEDTQRMLERAPWDDPVDPMEGIIVHELSKRTGEKVAQTA